VNAAARAALAGALALLAALETHAAESVPPAAIAAGAPRWVEAAPADPLLNARVDVGTIRAFGDELEVVLEWPVGPGMVNDARIADPKLVVPPGTIARDRERIECGASGALSYAIASAWVAPDGRTVRTRTFDAAAERSRAQASPYARAPYGRDPRSLVCMAVAAKCSGRPFAWPPAPNATPLEHSERADRMRAGYAAQFVPTCRL
jgi:hypothetical protein